MSHFSNGWRAALRLLAASSLACMAMSLTAAASTDVTSLALGSDADSAALIQDLSALLKQAEYNRGPSATGGPRNRITSVTRLANALHAHNGIAYVVTAARDEGDALTLKSVYRLEGAPIGRDAQAPAGASRKGAVYLDTNTDSSSALRDSLEAHLGALLGRAGNPAQLEAVIAALDQPRQAAYLVLTERAGEGLVSASQVFVVPDVLRINIADDTAAAAGEEPPQPAPEVELVPDPDGGPPLIKFEFDPTKYERRPAD
jgi:hypothetical protein